MAKNRQYGKVLVPAKFFLEADDCLKVEHLYVESLTDAHFRGVWKELLVAKIPTYGGKKIQWATVCEQIEMAITREMACRWSQMPLWLQPENRIERCEYCK